MAGSGNAGKDRYDYTARNSKGEMTRGQIAADSETSAARRLQAMGLAPLTVKRSSGGGGLSRNIGPPKRMKAKDVAHFCRQFSTMINAGLPLVRAVQAIGEQTAHPELKRVLPLVQADLERGNSFSSALTKYPHVFPPLLTGMVSAGEVSGSMGASLAAAADTFQKEAVLRSKTIAAMLYPMIIMILALCVVTGMLVFIVPKFGSIFASLGGQLPLPTRGLIFLSKQMWWFLPIAIGGLVAGSIWWRKNKRNRRVREIVDPLKLRIPILGGFLKKITVARFSRTFSSLLSAGVPMIQTLDIVSATANSIVISQAVDDIRGDVSAGKPIAATMASHDIFPPLVVQMVSTGEETGALPEMLIKVADFYEQEVDTAADALPSIIEPIMIVLLAVLIGGILVSLYLPLFSVFELIK